MERGRDNTDVETDKKVCMFKRARRPNVRQARKSSSSDVSDKSEENSDNSSEGKDKTVIYKREIRTKRGLTQRSNVTSKKTKTSVTGRDSDNNSSSDSENGDRRKHSFAFKGTGEDKSGPGDSGATAVNEIDTSVDRDARAIFERSKEANQERKVDTNKSKEHRTRIGYLRRNTLLLQSEACRTRIWERQIQLLLLAMKRQRAIHMKKQPNFCIC